MGLHEGGRPKTAVSETPILEKPTLASQGIDKNLDRLLDELHARQPVSASKRNTNPKRVSCITARTSPV